MAASGAVSRFSTALPQTGKKTVFFLCDVQERFRELIYRMPTVIHTSRTLIKTAHALSSPICVTQQYPKAFQSIMPELAELLHRDGAPATPVMDKKKFSMLTEEVTAHLNSVAPEYETAVLFGIEAHVCIQQTALELLHAGKRVYVVTDGVSSQRPGDRTIGLLQLSSAGALLTTTESLMYALIGGADHPNFKEVSKVLMEHHKLGKDLPPLDHLS